MDINSLHIPDFITQLPIDIFWIRQEIILVFAVFILLVLGKIPVFRKSLVPFVLLLFFAFCAWMYFIDFVNVNESITPFGQLLVVDRLAIAFRLLFTFSGVLATIIYYLHKKDPNHTAYPILLLSVILGLDFLVMANHWTMVFLSIETVSICSYLLVSLEKEKIHSEAGIKYVLFGAASSAVMLYAISWLYGIQGTLLISVPLVSTPTTTFFILLILSGIVFKISAFPFHFWAPDVYQGAPGYLLPFLSYAPKAGAFILLSRLTMGGLLDMPFVLSFLVIAALGSLLIGNWGALRQDNGLRLMAYSGIAQAGFILAAICCGALGVESFLFYLVIYLFMSFSVIYMLFLIYEKTGSYSIQSLKGFGQKNPILGVALVIGMVSLAGLPPTIGFSGKILIFSSLWSSFTETNQINFLLLLIGSGILTLTSFYFYLKIPFYLFVKRNETNLAVNLFFKEKIMVMLLTAPMILLFFLPQKLNNFVKLINLVY